MQPCLKSVESTLAIMCEGFLTIQIYCCDDCYRCMGSVMKSKVWHREEECESGVSFRVTSVY